MPAGVFAVALALGLIRLGAPPLSFDEQFTRDTATRSWSGIWDAARDTEAPHLVYYSLLKPWLAAFGTTDWALRLPSALFGALAAAATAIVGRRLFGELAGLWAGLALAASSYFVYWSQAARGYTLAVLLATVATYAFIRACDERSITWWTIWAVTLAAAGWVNVFAFSVAAAHLAAFLLIRPRPELRTAVIAGSVALALFLPQLVLVTSGDNGQLDWIPTPTPYRVAVGMWDWASRNPIVVLAAAVGVVQLFRQATRWKAALVVVWLVAPLAATLLASISQPAFEARYVLVAMPAFALAIGFGVAALPRRWAIALGVALALSMAVRLGQHFWAPGEELIR
jgi:mannosyltransferase